MNNAQAKHKYERIDYEKHDRNHRYHNRTTKNRIFAYYADRKINYLKMIHIILEIIHRSRRKYEELSTI